MGKNCFQGSFCCKRFIVVIQRALFGLMAIFSSQAIRFDGAFPFIPSDFMLWKFRLCGHDVIGEDDEFVYIQKVDFNNEPLIMSYREELSRETGEFVRGKDLSKVFDQVILKDENSSDEYLVMSECYMVYTYGIVCGYIQYAIHEEKVACIEEFFIEKSFRKQGIGEKTLKALECHLRRQEVDSVHLTVLEANQPAFKLYQKMSFVVKRSFKANGSTGFLMQKKTLTHYK